MHNPQERPAEPGFWGERTGWQMLKQVLFLEPLPGGSRWAAAFGSLLLVAFALQVATGILLTMNYAPSVESAWPSVKFIEEEVPLGSFIRALHHWGSSAMVVLLLAHMVQVFVWGAYKKPRELTWMCGVLLLACTLGLAFTGYLLPWDQKAYWSTRVGLGIASTTPGIGDAVRTLLQGGGQMGNLTLTRFFSIHTFLLPGALILLVVAHLYLFRLHGVTPPWWESPAQLKSEEEPFWPKQLLKDGVCWFCFLVALSTWAYYRPAPLELQADPAQPYEARPEWYFMFLFRLLRYFEGPYEIVGTFVLPLTFFLVLFFWPFIDRSPHRDPRRRPVSMGLFGAATAGLIGLTIVAVATDVRMTEPKQSLAQSSARPAEPAGPIQHVDAAKVYNDNCAACHSVDGSGQQIRSGMPTIPDFTSLVWQKSRTELEITHHIYDGDEPLMPAYREKLGEEQILALTFYIRAFSVTPAEPVPHEKPQQPVPPAPAAAMSPSQIYVAYCLACHDADGSGASFRKLVPLTPDFTDPQWLASKSDAEFQAAILDGKGKLMLPMKYKLGSTDVEKMVEFVRAFAGRKQVVASEPKEPLIAPPQQPTVVGAPLPSEKPSRNVAASAEAAARTRAATGLYRQYCLVCHGNDGTGREMKGSMPNMPDFTDRAWQEKVGSDLLLAGVLDGKGTLMPAFRGRVNDAQGADLVAYVRAFGPIRTKVAEPAPDDFEARFNELRQQWNDLHRQLRDYTPPVKQ
jgi:ubiquinol-cytochrome c reductase cytochrome b subunit